MTKLLLYGTDSCHLCEEAEMMLQSLLETSPQPFEVEQRDIALVPELMALYGIRIPVIKNRESGEELGWPFDKSQLSRFLHPLVTA